MSVLFWVMIFTGALIAATALFGMVIAVVEYKIKTEREKRSEKGTQQ